MTFFGKSLMLNADIDTMGRPVENGIRDREKYALQEADLKDIHEELRKQLLYRELLQRELEFLENGGDPLDYRFGNESSVSAQSISLTDQHHEQFVTSKEKVDISLVGVLAHSDETTTRQRVKVCNANIAENLLLVDGENQPAEVENNSINLNIKRNIAPLAQSTLDKGTQNGKEHEETTIFRPYTRRNRSKPNRSVSRSVLIDLKTSQGDGHGRIPSRHCIRDTKGSVFGCGSNNVDRNISSILDEKPTSLNTDKTRTFTNISKLDSKCSPDVETAAGILEESSTKDSLYMLTFAGQQQGLKNPAHVVDRDITLKDVAADMAVRHADLPSKGCTHSENAHKSDEGNPIVSEIEGRGVQGNTQAEAESDASAVPIKTLDSGSFTQDSLSDGDTCPIMVLKQPLSRENCKTTEKWTVKNTNKCDIGQISSDLQNQLDYNLEVRVQDMSEMNIGLQAGDSVSMVSEGPQICNSVVSGICSIHGNSSVCDRNLDNGGTTNEQPITETVGVSLAKSSGNNLADASEAQTGFTRELEKVDEDSILAEALLIEAKHKRISELLAGTPRLEKQQKHHWDFVLEEMAWLANDFMQERLWKMSTAALFGHRTALASRRRAEEKMTLINIRAIAQSNARAVLQFWQSVESSGYPEDKKIHVHDNASQIAVIDQTEESKIVQEPKSVFDRHGLIKNHAIKNYAIRFLKYNASIVPYFHAEARLSSDLEFGLWAEKKECLLKNDLADETLFYKVPPGAVECYRKSIESHVLQCEVSGSRLQEAETPLSTEEHMYMGEERELDTSYYPGAFEERMAFEPAKKKRKNPVNAYVPGTYDMGADLTYERHPTGFYSRSALTKRTGTGSRQRVESPHDVEVGGNKQLLCMTDASSEDTSYFEDNNDVDYQIEHAVNFEKDLHLGTRRDLTNNRKKKKIKRMNSSRDRRWQLDTALSNEQRCLSRKRLDNQQLEFSEINGTAGQLNAKRLKTMKQTLPGLNSRTVPSLVRSHISNKPHQYKFMRTAGGRDQTTKEVLLKVPSGQPGSVNMWSSFEDQALVVLVHDLGPNWELVSDAMNSNLQFMHVFLKPDECKDRHLILMDQTTDDGADSAEDSVSSYPYPSTLPGIPKGTAGQLFQLLQEPVEHDTMKSHFKKIISIRQKKRYQKNQNGVLDQKQVVPRHVSHAVALSEVCSNYPSGGHLTPLDLCDPPPTNLEPVSHGRRGPPHSVHPACNSSNQGPQGLIAGNNVPPAMGPLNSSNRSTQQSSLSDSGTPLASDLNSAHAVTKASSTCMMSGSTSQSLLMSNGDVSTSSMMKMPNHLNLGVDPSKGISTSNSSGGHVAQNKESQRKTTAPELHLNASQGCNRGTTPFQGIRSNFPGRTLIPMGETQPVHNQPQRQMPPHLTQGHTGYPRIRGPSVSQRPAYDRLVQERQFQRQQLIQKQHSPMTPPTPISQSPMPLQNSQLRSHPLSPSAISPASQPHQKHNLLNPGLNLPQSGLGNHIGVQGHQLAQPAQPFNGSGKHPHSQQTQSQQLPVNANGLCTSSIGMPQNAIGNSSHLNRISLSSGGQSADRIASLHALGSTSTSTSMPAQHFRSQAPQSSGQTLQQKRLHSSALPRNPVQQTPSNSANCSEREISSRSSSLGNADQECKSHKALEPSERITSRSPCVEIATALPHITGSNGHASVNSPSIILLRTESELYDSVLQNFDSQMSSAGKLAKNSYATKPDPKVGQGVLQRQLSSSMAPQQKESTRQPNRHSADAQGNSLTHQSIK